jgi:hypothetical protein
VSGTDGIPHAIWSGSFHMFGVEVKCYVLSTGQRVIDANSMNELMLAMGSSEEIDPGDLGAFGAWQRGHQP